MKTHFSLETRAGAFHQRPNGTLPDLTVTQVEDLKIPITRMAHVNGSLVPMHHTMKGVTLHTFLTSPLDGGR